jgi:signal transduction histidine kinase/class 3 adenylate cyclase
MGDPFVSRHAPRAWSVARAPRAVDDRDGADRAAPACDDGAVVNAARRPAGRPRRVRAFARALAFAARVAIAAALLAAFAPAARAAEGQVVRVDDTFAAEGVGRRMRLALDPSCRVTVDEAAASLALGDGVRLRFQAADRDVPNFSYTRACLWAVFRVEDTRAARAPLVFEVDYPPLDRVDLFVREAGMTVRAEAAGDHVPKRQWPRGGTVPSFELPASPAYDVWVRVETGSALQLPASLRTPRAQAHESEARIAAHALYFGALAAMAIYNLLVWASIRSRAYLYYVAFLVCYGIMQAGLNGVAYAAWWPEGTAFSDMLIPRFIVLQGLAALLFVRSLLGVARSSRGAARAAMAIAAFGTVVFAATLFGSYVTVMRLLLPLVVVWAAYMIAVGVAAARAGERVARYYLGAWGFFAAGAAVIALSNLGVLASNRLTRNATALGSACEFLLLSFALADRMKQLQAEATANAELAASHARAAQEATGRALAEQERANAELVRLDQLKDEFLANTSHELRTPIHGVTGVLEAVLARTSLAAADRDEIGHALDSAERLSDLVTSVLDFSLLRSGRGSLERLPVDVAAIVDAEVAHARPRARVPMKVREHARVHAVLGDAARLRQLFVQILGNAVKFTDSGAIAVVVREEPGEVVVEVTDTGPGIPPQRAAAIFAGLEQGDGSATREAGGLGIGLALARRIADAHGGKLVLESSVGVGTTVTVRLPSTLEVAAPDRHSRHMVALARAAARGGEYEGFVAFHSKLPPRPTDARSLAPRAPGEALGRPRSPALGAPRAPAIDALATAADGQSLPVPEGIGEIVRVLVADDDPMNRRVIRLQLAPLGFEIVEAGDGAEAIRLAREEGPFDAILLDVMMPKASGYEVCRKVRETHSATDLPVLMLTAKTQLRDLIEGFESGANDYIPKPFSKAELLARLRTHVAAARTHGALRRFVPHGALELLGHANVTEARLGDAKERTLAILFADVHGFTALAETRTPLETFALLNACYAIVGPAVREAGGFVDKYVGDAVMAVFPTGAGAALRAAVAMQRALAASPLHREGLALGVGIHAGRALVGTLGEESRFDATVVSDTVNLASRIEGASKQLGAKVLVSEAALAGAGAHGLEVRALGAVQVKGRGAPVRLVEVLDAEDPATADAKRATRAPFSRGLEAFARGAFEEAYAAFADARDRCPEDGAAALYFAATARAMLGDADAVGAGGALVLREK